MHEDFKRLRGEGKSVKGYWFNQRMRQLIREHYPDSIEEFKNSDQWFARFCRRFKVSLRRKTHAAQKTPAGIRPLLIFRGQGLRIKNSKKEQWDKRVTFHFQKNAWCDEGVMVTWIQNDWGSYFSNPSTPGSDGKLLIADIHRGQQTDT